MADLTWKDAIVKVLTEENKPLHYTEITELIDQREYRKALGATPQNTVSSQLTGNPLIFEPLGGGEFRLRSSFVETVSGKVSKEKEDDTDKKIKVINAFGIYWNKDGVEWKQTTPDLFGVQSKSAHGVNFKDQIGVYLLHDVRETIYVGQAIDQPIVKRLKFHTKDRLANRWDRFSWFGFYPVNEDGTLNNNVNLEGLTIKNMGDLLEAILIESIEPRQNMKKGNSFVGEFLQRETS
jgi:hypothetical protein